MGESARRLCCFRWEVSTFIGVDGCEGLFTGEVTRVLYDFRRKVGTFTGATGYNAVIRE